MTNTLKSIFCIEWILVSPITYNETVESGCFTFKNQEWKLQFYSGCNKDPKEYILLKSDQELNIAVDLIVTAFTEKHKPRSEKHSIKDKEQIIWTNHDTPLSGDLLNVLMYFGNLLKDDKSVQTPSYIDTHFLLESVSKDFSKLFDDDSSHDVQFTCEDKTIPAHKNVLCCRSSVFASMLQSEMVEGKTGRVNIQDMNAKIFQQFLKGLYTGILPELTFETAVQFYKASDKYAIDTLKKQCTEFLKDHLSHENACEILVVADRHSDSDLKEDVLEYIFKEKIPIVGENWNDFCNKNLKLAVEVLNLFCQHVCRKESP